MAQLCRTEAGARFVDLARIGQDRPELRRAPRTTLLVLENIVRCAMRGGASPAQVHSLISNLLDGGGEIPFRPHRVVLQDASGLPALLDVAALRDSAAEAGRDPNSIDLACQVDLIVDHSILATRTGRGASSYNLAEEYAANDERFRFLRWAEQAFERLTVFPSGNGIIHQINLEQLSSAVVHDGEWLFPETLIGTDSHTTMINGLGVLGWGVGGVEASAVMLGNSVTLPALNVVALEFVGRPPPGIMAMDIALSLAAFLRQENVVDCFLEAIGPGLAWLSLEDRATIANMTPEYGATTTLFPWDQAVLDYLADTGRATDANRCSQYLALNPLLSVEQDQLRHYDRRLTFDLSALRHSIAGPVLPHQSRPLGGVWTDAPAPPAGTGGLRDGDIVLAAITSCTNTANARAMVTAGLVAKKAVASGLRVASHIKTSLSPGSRRVAEYLHRLGLDEPLGALGFHAIGFGCMTCVGNSGELPSSVMQQIERDKLNVAAVLSGNRNFSGRVHPAVQSSFLASPPLVVAYALYGRMTGDITTSPLGLGKDGPVFLSDIWPGEDEIAAALGQIGLGKALPVDREKWEALPRPEGSLFPWPETSTYLVRPQPRSISARNIVLPQADILLLLGDNVTTDHISPVGRIAPDSPAAKALQQRGVAPADFNTYGARRGNAPIMRLGTFANPNLPNSLSGGRPGNFTRDFVSGEVRPIPDVAAAALAAGRTLVVVAGKNYGVGSARDWAAKGTAELGISAVIAESFERIHRTNLALVGVLPLQVLAPIDLTGRERLAIRCPESEIQPWCRLELEITLDAKQSTIPVICRLQTKEEVSLWRIGGFMNAFK